MNWRNSLFLFLFKVKGWPLKRKYMYTQFHLTVKMKDKTILTHMGEK